MKSSKKPIFIVGCSRSGTTLVQSILSNLPGWASFPETNILYLMHDDLDFQRFGFNTMHRRGLLKLPVKRVLNLLGYTHRNMRPHFLRYLKKMNRMDLAHLIPQNLHSKRAVINTFIEMMEALSEGRPWIEKTPQNILCVHEIDRYGPDCIVVHVIRNGMDNVGSLIDAGKKYDIFRDRFGGPDGVRRAIAFYNNCLLISQMMKLRPNHSFIRYEDLVNNPIYALRNVGKLLETEIEPQHLRYSTKGITFGNEVWKEGKGTEIKKQPSRFHTALSLKEQGYAGKHLLNAQDFFPRETNDEDQRITAAAE